MWFQVNLSEFTLVVSNIAIEKPSHSSFCVDIGLYPHSTKIKYRITIVDTRTRTCIGTWTICLEETKLAHTFSSKIYNFFQLQIPGCISIIIVGNSYLLYPIWTHGHLISIPPFHSIYYNHRIFFKNKRKW